MQQAERREVREKAACSAERSTPLIMVASWKQLFFHLLLLLCCRLTQTKSAGPSAPPEPPSSPLPTLSKRVVLKGDVYMERVEVVSPVILELECNWTGDADRYPNVTGFWSKDGTEIEESRLTVPLKNEHYHLQQKFNIVSQENLGNYSCVFGGDAKINFVLAAPQMGEVRDKPIVSYVGDTALITCKMEDTKPPPTTWIWYKANGTEKEQILAATESQRHEIKNQERKTQLVVHNLTEADSGSYFCSAVYAISSTLGHVELKVITFYEPLKPFMAIVIEVTVLVAAILLYEKSRSKKTSSAGILVSLEQIVQLCAL
ncbi:Embigin Precursor [Takifugu flavidus]|uniref:Embigin n=1 Tax=Takifugu flavidus TaxID=433684 RepID=A0A5C6N3G7_9TELE|nr:Embigin Precursor [Takifugu flavidus]